MMGHERLIKGDIVRNKFAGDGNPRRFMVYLLFVHCFLYTIPFYIVFGWCWQLALIGILHFPIDALKAKWGKTNYVQDQILHYILAASYLL